MGPVRQSVNAHLRKLLGAAVVFAATSPPPNERCAHASPPDAGAAPPDRYPVHTPTADEAKEAQQLFEHGRQLMRDKKWEDALPLLEKSAWLDPKEITLLHLALCQESVGRLRLARMTYARLAGSTNEARIAIARIDVMMATVRITIADAPVGEADVHVTIDGEPVTEPLDKIHIEPGTHQVVVEVSGERYEQVLDVHAHDALTVRASFRHYDVVDPIPPPARRGGCGCGKTDYGD